MRSASSLWLKPASTPLPTTPFDFGIVPSEDRVTVEAMLAFIEPICIEHLDAEYFTVSKRLLEIAAASPEHPLRASTTPARLAAAIVWVTLAGNDEPRSRTPAGRKEIWAWFGTSSCTRLARSLSVKLGYRSPFRPGAPISWDMFPGIQFRNVNLLHSEWREELIDELKNVNQMILDEEARHRLERPTVQSGSTW